jgi:hypothetical protein
VGWEGESDIRFIEVLGLMQPVATRPAVRIACGDGMYILALVDRRGTGRLI